MRIIAGSARGRRFDAPKGMDTRPTLDQVKEAMFGMIQFDVPDSAVLDLFSGSGNLGLEAASRGARRVVCNDRAAGCAAQIRANVQTLGFCGVVSVSQMDYADCIRSLARRGERFDFVFLDAPYADGAARTAAEQLLAAGLLLPGGRIILEHDPSIPPAVSERLAERVTTRRYGNCAVTILKGIASS